ncbi:hypothetical protein O59_002657 [Cellvibrio sp. BR]|jgi:hypothetical protein|nr:hypothetical protein O59_002657 [Cellvibrio sp. BR]
MAIGYLNQTHWRLSSFDSRVFFGDWVIFVGFEQIIGL